MFGTLKLWIAGIGAAFVAALMLWAKVLKAQRDKARRSRDLLVAGRASERKKQKIIKEEEEETETREAELLRVIKEKEDEFTGVGNLTDSNDNW